MAVFVPLDQLTVTDPADISARIGRSVSVFKNGAASSIIKEIIAARNNIGEYLFIEEFGLIGIGVNKSKVEQKLISVRRKREGHELPESVPVPQIKKFIYNKIIMITGGAQGFGEGIARSLFHRGANIIIGDIPMLHFNGKQIAEIIGDIKCMIFMRYPIGYRRIFKVYNNF